MASVFGVQDQSVQTYYNTAAQKASTKAQEGVPQEKAETPTNKTENKDGFAPSKQSESVTYKKTSTNKLNSAQVQQLMSDAQQRVDNFNKLLTSMFVKQGQKSNLTLFGQKLYVTPQQSADAAKAISEDGEWGVNAVATRIMDMAKALSGGDASKISALRSAVEKGFKAAGVDFGGKLPSICGNTYDEVMKRFDDWEKEASETGKTEVTE